MQKKVLFISIDGMTDPLGQSQVLPYLVGLSRLGYQFTLLSLEKIERFEKNKSIIEKICIDNNINWQPLHYSTTPPIISKLFNRFKLFSTARKLHNKYAFSIVHCRGYASGEVGMYLKKHFDIPYIFDMRGFWPEEKKDSSVWPQSKWVYRQVYQYYKKQEKKLLDTTAHIISLTYAGKREMETWAFYKPSIPITVIPCCADMNHFSLNDSEQKKSSRNLLNIPKNAFVVSYLGSIGSWYMLDEMLELYKVISLHYQNAIFLCITLGNPHTIFKRANEFGIAENNIIVREAGRSEVPAFMKSSDITLSFIKPTYSKLSSSPTKLGEIMAMGIPVITNDKVGDVAEIVKDRGYVINKFTMETYQNAVEAIPALLNLNSVKIRERALEWFDLEQGVKKYADVYDTVLKSR